MSYLRYSPDVRPVPAEQYVPPPSRVWRWMAGVMLYFVWIAAWTWWMTLPPKIQPPLATIPLPDGTELRLVEVVRGADFIISDRETYDDRVRPANEQRRGWGTYAQSARPNSTWLVFTLFDPRTEEFSYPSISDFWVVDENPHFSYRVPLASQPRPADLPCQLFCVDVAPSRAANWKVQLGYRLGVVQGSLPNPRPAAKFAEFTPQPLPQKVTVDGATIELIGVKVAMARADQADPGAIPEFKVSLADLDKNAFAITHEFFDATGNRTSQGVLPFSEPAWGVKVRALQTKFSEGAPGKIVSLGEFAVPKGGEAIPLPVPPALAAQGVTDLIFVGPGSYRFGSGTLRSTVTPAGSPATKIANTELSMSTSTAKPAVFLLTTQTEPPATPPGMRRVPASYHSSSWSEGSGMKTPVDEIHFRLHEGANIFPLVGGNSAKGTVTTGYRTNNYSFRSNEIAAAEKKTLAAGSKITLDYVDPQSIEATFYFPPPPPPKGK